METLHIRPATVQDVTFLVQSILDAEASGTDLVSYQRLFELSDVEMREKFSNIVREDIEGQELCYVNFWIAEINNQPVAATAAWIEGENGFSSNTIKAQLLAEYLGMERWRAAQERLKAISVIDMAREKGTLQLDAIAVVAEQRGKGILQELLKIICQNMHVRYPALSKAQILLMNNNERALKAYEKAGFSLVKETRSDDPILLTLLPGNGRLLLERHLNPNSLVKK